MAGSTRPVRNRWKRSCAFMSRIVRLGFSGLLVLIGLASLAVIVSPLTLPAWVPCLVGATAACAVGGLLALPLSRKLPWGWKMASRLERFQTALKTLRSPALVARTTLLSL